jgi:polyisoprenoid-binding protein YceI
VNRYRRSRHSPGVDPSRHLPRPGRSLAVAIVLVLALGAALPAIAAERLLRLDPATTTVRFRVKARAHQVLGTMPLELGELRFDPATGEAGGEIVLDPSRAETGIQMRDRTMRQEVFEVERFPRIVFRPRRLAGEVPSEGTAIVGLEGVLEIHGTEQPMTLPVTISAEASGIRATTAFDVPYVAWGMKNPGNQMLRVADVVEVRIETSGVLE